MSDGVRFVVELILPNVSDCLDEDCSAPSVSSSAVDPSKGRSTGVRVVGLSGNVLIGAKQVDRPKVRIGFGTALIEIGEQLANGFPVVTRRIQKEWRRVVVVTDVID